jgi:pimeloyl-ACP methyl ester carboxylesterase
VGDKIFFPNKKGISLCGILERDSQKNDLIILVHGFAGNKDENGLFRSASERFVKEGFQTFRYDMTGVGESKGEYSAVSLNDLVKDYESALEFVKRICNPSGLAIVAFSLGATIALLSSIRDVTSYSFWSPAFFPNKDIYPRYNTLEIKKELHGKGYIDKGGVNVGKRLVEDISLTDLTDELKKIRKPVQIIHGDCDERIDYESSLLAHNLIESSDIHIIEGEGHSYKNKFSNRNYIYGLTLDWFRQAKLKTFHPIR